MKREPPVVRRHRLRAIAAARDALDLRVGSRAMVLGSMLGVKLRAGTPTNVLSISYIVEKKLPRSKLSPRQRIPTRLRTDRGYIPTDVVEWPAMVEQSAVAPTILTDGATHGTLSCFAATPFGLYGVSCAHCLVGPDRNPATPANIAHFDQARGTWTVAGDSFYLAYSPGSGVTGNYGYWDVGLFSLDDAGLARRAASALPVRCVANALSLLGQRVFAVSTLTVPGSPAAARSATVIGVECDALQELCDVVLQVDPPGTFVGDSGMAWMTGDRRLAVIHARGEISPSGSRLTTGMLAIRAAKLMNLELRVG